MSDVSPENSVDLAMRCCVDVWDEWDSHRCRRNGKITVKTDRGDFLFCSQHLATFKRNGVWVRYWGQSTTRPEFIKPHHVLLAEREALGV